MNSTVLYLIYVYKLVLLPMQCDTLLIQVAIAQGFHLVPFRTEKLSLVTRMVLRLSG